jgi:hypothetical protein
MHTQETKKLILVKCSKMIIIRVSTVSIGENILVFKHLWRENLKRVNDTTDDFNGQELVLTKEIISDLRKEIDSDYWESFCSGGFFWGHQYQEQSVKQYSQQDKLFCDWALTQLEKRRRSNLFLLVVKKELD